jgi:hypothetical protein
MNTAIFNDEGDYSGFPMASQVAHTAIRLGTNATDHETVSQGNSTALGDDAAGTDDEDLTLPVFTLGQASTLNVPVTLNTSLLASATSRVRVFVDWNGDGDVADTGETQAVQSATATGVRSFSLTPPTGTTAGTKYLRVRITEGGTTPAFSGASIGKGEVEDYAITVNCPTLTMSLQTPSDGTVGTAYSRAVTTTGTSGAHRADTGCQYRHHQWHTDD